MTKGRKYDTPQEARAAIALAMRAHWRDPMKRRLWTAKLKEAQEKRLAALDTLRGETLEQFLREYVERDPSGERDYRYDQHELAKRYLISPDYVWNLASHHGVRRAKKKKKLTPRAVAEIVRLYVGTDIALADLARRFKVSSSAIKYRLVSEGVDLPTRTITSSIELRRAA